MLNYIKIKKIFMKSSVYYKTLLFLKSLKLIKYICFILVVLGFMEKNYVWILAYSYNLFNADISYDIHISI